MRRNEHRYFLISNALHIHQPTCGMAGVGWVPVSTPVLFGNRLWHIAPCGVLVLGQECVYGVGDVPGGWSFLWSVFRSIPRICAVRLLFPPTEASTC